MTESRCCGKCGGVCIESPVVLVITRTDDRTTTRHLLCADCGLALLRELRRGAREPAPSLQGG